MRFAIGPGWVTQYQAYDQLLKERAKQLRKHMTLSEVLLWNKLKNKQVLGYDFDRQRPIDRYIVDFFCKQLNLAIEIDGRSHDFKSKEDAERQTQLEKMGVRFIRLWDYEVKHDMSLVLERIRGWILEEQRTHPARWAPLHWRGSGEKNPPRPKRPPLQRRGPLKEKG
jgi:very-short-patch-repair endonuclease